MKHEQSKEHIQACKNSIEACLKCEELCNSLIDMGHGHPDFASQCEQMVAQLHDTIQACHDCSDEHKEHMEDCPDRDCKRMCESSLKSLHDCIDRAEKLMKHCRQDDELCLSLCKEFIQTCHKCIQDCKSCLTKKELLQK